MENKKLGAIDYSHRGAKSNSGPNVRNICRWKGENLADAVRRGKCKIMGSAAAFSCPHQTCCGPEAGSSLMASVCVSNTEHEPGVYVFASYGAQVCRRAMAQPYPTGEAAHKIVSSENEPAPHAGRGAFEGAKDPDSEESSCSTSPREGYGHCHKLEPGRLFMVLSAGVAPRRMLR
jgi:hypothetical protein